MNVLVHTDRFQGEIRLTAGGPFRHHTNVILLRTAADEAFRPGDLITIGGRTVVAALMVYEWASQDGRSEEEVTTARGYLRQWPIGPQIK